MTEFRPPRWLANAHLQTCGAAASLFAPPRSFVAPAVEATWIPIPAQGHDDEGTLGSLLAETWWQPGGEPRPLAMVVHGIGGSSRSMYVLRAAVALHRAGFHVTRLNLQGAGEGIARAAVLYHAGLTRDVDAAVRAFVAHPRVCDVLLVGFSLGGNIVLKLAGEWGDRPPGNIRGVAGISPAVDLEPLVHAFDRPRAFFYRRYILVSLVAQARSFARRHPGRAPYDPWKLFGLSSVRAFDARVVVPMHGFPSTEVYYAQASAAPWIARIGVPALVVHADDDPLVPAWTVKRWLYDLPSCVRVAWSERGGHVGWFAGLHEKAWIQTWAMQRVLDFAAG